jgi:glycosyltransferase involved in cell wall biosynthesis
VRQGQRIGVVIPALNEAQAIGRVIAAIPSWVDEIVVADNGSSDGTGAIAEAAGARVVVEPERGYGAACVAGIAALESPAVVVFLDGDFSDHPDEMAGLVDPILAGEADLVIGSRVLGRSECGALTPQQRFGNWLACRLMAALWGAGFTDLGPFRAISTEALLRLAMADRNYGWTIEMQIKALEAGLRTQELAVSYRRRIGVSKVSGTLSGSVRAGAKILAVIAASYVRRIGKARAEAGRGSGEG